MPLRANGGIRSVSAKVEGVISRYTHCKLGHGLPRPQSTSSNAPESLAQAKEEFGGWGHTVIWPARDKAEVESGGIAG